MKFLIATNLLQTVCLLVLVVFLLGDDKDTTVPPSATPAFGKTSMSSAVQPGVDETRLRQIIREELAQTQSNELPSSDIAAQQRSPEENRYQREYVSQQIDYYASVGEISEQDMHELQREIAALDKAGRKEMLGKLTRAMNARQIKGQL